MARVRLASASELTGKLSRLSLPLGANIDTLDMARYTVTAAVAASTTLPVDSAGYLDHIYHSESFQMQQYWVWQTTPEMWQRIRTGGGWLGWRKAI